MLRSSSLTLLFFINLFFLGCSEEKPLQTKKALPPLQVETITLKKQAVPIWKQYTGMTKASNSHEVKARVSGILEEIYFKDGEFVTKGQKLFKIQQDEYIAALDAAKANKRKNEASLALAISDVYRYRPLVDEGLAPRATLEQYEAKQEELKASIAVNTAEIKQAELKLSYTTIKAPISGRISARLVDIGNLVGQGESTKLTTIVQTDPLYAYFSPSQDDVRLFQKFRDKENPDVFIEVDGTLEKIRLNGYVDFANNTVDKMTSTITMRATLENKHNKVLPGTFVYVNLFINDKYEFLMIPPEVIFSDQLGKYVYIADTESKVEKKYITTNYSTKHYISVSKGLKSGDRLIVSSLIKLKEGRVVKQIDVSETKGIDAILKNNKLIPSKS